MHTLPILADRAQAALARHGVRAKRATVIEAVTAALGFRSRGEATAASKAGLLDLPLALPDTAGTTPMCVLRDPVAGKLFGIERSSLPAGGDRNADMLATTPYGNLVRLPDAPEATARPRLLVTAIVTATVRDDAATDPAIRALAGTHPFVFDAGDVDQDVEDDGVDPVDAHAVGLFEAEHRDTPVSAALASGALKARVEYITEWATGTPASTQARREPTSGRTDVRATIRLVAHDARNDRLEPGDRPGIDLCAVEFTMPGGIEAQRTKHVAITHEALELFHRNKDTKTAATPPGHRLVVAYELSEAPDREEPIAGTSWAMIDLVALSTGTYPTVHATREEAHEAARRHIEATWRDGFDRDELLVSLERTRTEPKGSFADSGDEHVWVVPCKGDAPRPGSVGTDTDTAAPAPTTDLWMVIDDTAMIEGELPTLHATREAAHAAAVRAAEEKWGNDALDQMLAGLEATKDDPDGAEAYWEDDGLRVVPCTVAGDVVATTGPTTPAIPPGVDIDDAIKNAVAATIMLEDMAKLEGDPAALMAMLADRSIEQNMRCAQAGLEALRAIRAARPRQTEGERGDATAAPSVAQDQGEHGIVGIVRFVPDEGGQTREPLRMDVTDRLLGLPPEEVEAILGGEQDAWTIEALVDDTRLAGGMDDMDLVAAVEIEVQPMAMVRYMEAMGIGAGNPVGTGITNESLAKWRRGLMRDRVGNDG